MGRRRSAAALWMLLTISGAACTGGGEGGGSEGDGPEVASDTDELAGPPMGKDLDVGSARSTPKCERWVKAEVVALEQAFTYNRFGTFNPNGMIYALRRDVVSVDGDYDLKPGRVRLREDKRPRPLVLRANEGDCLKVIFTNLLSPEREKILSPPDVPFHAPFPAPVGPPGNDMGDGPGAIHPPLPAAGEPGELPDMVDGAAPVEELPEVIEDLGGGGGPQTPDLDGGGVTDPGTGDPDGDGPQEDFRADSPRTRSASVHIQGLHYLDIDDDGTNVGRNESSLAAPGETRVYRVYADREGTFLFYSGAHLAGGEGDNAALASGFFGAVSVQPRGSVWYRSQVTARELEKATVGKNRDGTPKIDFDAKDDGRPILRMLDDDNELLYGDLYAIIDRTRATDMETSISVDEGVFREFVVLFHDEIEAVQAFPELETDPTLRSTRDGFAINYGADAIGPRVLANRKRIGPSRECGECKFEEFFLSSWPNGDPALNVVHDERGRAVKALYPDDPSNVTHSYLGDPVRIRNLHAGPRETHVFHLHGHQWLHTPRNDSSNFVDAQSISPGSAYTYNINFGGSGNRNLTVGDAIFHCHLYPHFAGGMWALWRVHDVFEAGTKDRYLPDGEIERGVPTPAVVPLPGRAMPPMPTYDDGSVKLADGSSVWRPAMPGYPFFMAARPGHRAPQPPYDMEFNGGLPRHVVTKVKAAEFGARGDFDVQLERINIKLLDEKGTPAERKAMQFHAGEFAGGRPTVTRYGFAAASYPAYTPEGRRSEFLVNGQPPKEGAPFSDPCPRGSVDRVFKLSHIQLDMVVNREGWHDPQARIMALDRDVEDYLDGKGTPEPLVMRANSGECVVIKFSNQLPSVLEEDDFQIFTPTDTSGMHVHLVKFDLTSSDGSANGWNYEDGSFAPEEVQERISAANAAGGAFEEDGTTWNDGDRVRLKAQRHPRLSKAPLGTQTTVQRWFADALENRVGVDRLLGTSFTHDHFSPSSHQQHGLYGAIALQPAGAIWRDPKTGAQWGNRDDGGPTAPVADVITADPQNSFRDYLLAFADFALLYDDRGKPINRPGDELKPLPVAIGDPERPFREAISQADPGSMLINYRNEPIPLRIARRKDGRYVQKHGEEGNMENVFSSDVHGDPYTPILRAYAGDRVVIRALGAAQEEYHAINLHGLRWLREPADPHSGPRNSEIFAISERFELAEELPPNSRPVVDYLYQSVNTDDLWNGMWGLLRAYRDPQPDLKPLPGKQQLGTLTHPTCPPGAPERKYTVYAITAEDNLPHDRVVYNKRFDLYDPDAILYVRDIHVDEVMSGKRKPEPLILRANAGDCIEVTLINALPDKMPKTPHWNFLPPITERFNVNQVRPSNHASLHPQLVEYDVTDSDGARVGRNPDTTVAPGQSRTYRWYAGTWTLTTRPGPLLFPFATVSAAGGARNVRREFVAAPVEYGTVNLRDVADVVNHGMAGGVGALIIEPRGAKWDTDEKTDAQATVWYRDAQGRTQSFREFVLVYQDEVGLHSDDRRFQCADPSLRCGTALLPYSGEADSEESGHKAFNYRTEPLWARIGVRPEEALTALNEVDQTELLDSEDFGDPATPVFTARRGQDVRFRVLQPSAHPRVHAFALYGHNWQENPWALGTESRVIGRNPESNIVGVQTAHGAMRHWNINPVYGAGGPYEEQGDYLYRDQPSVQFSDGLWGIFRVK